VRAHIMELLTRISFMSQVITVRKTSEADLPTRFGYFRILGFEGSGNGNVIGESVVLRMGDLSGDPPLVRIHSQCLTGPRDAAC
jgi:GTP cyclohydrolase II